VRLQTCRERPATRAPTGRPFSEIAGILKGKLPVLVIGGAETALDDYNRASKLFPAAFIISANQHAWKLSIKAHMATCVDQFHTRLKKPMQEVLQPYGVPIVSPLWWADYHLTDFRERAGYSAGSGMVAAMVGMMLGAHTVVLCGFTWQRQGLGTNSKEFTVHRTTGNETIRVASGDLLKLWPGMTVPARQSHQLDYICMR
jgi:hypothetical protein